MPDSVTVLADEQVGIDRGRALRVVARQYRDGPVHVCLMRLELHAAAGAATAYELLAFPPRYLPDLARALTTVAAALGVRG